MLAITVTAPRALSIARYGCRVVNRSASPPEGWRLDAVVAIHAAERERALYTEAERVALLARIDVGRIRRESAAVRGKIVALARLRAVTTNSRLVNCDRRWWVGPVGIVLSDVQPIDGMVTTRAPVGNVGTWELPQSTVDDLERAVVELMKPRAPTPPLVALAGR